MRNYIGAGAGGLLSVDRKLVGGKEQQNYIGVRGLLHGQEAGHWRGTISAQEQVPASPWTGRWSDAKSNVFPLTRSQSLANKDAVKSELEQTQ